MVTEIFYGDAAVNEAIGVTSRNLKRIDGLYCEKGKIEVYFTNFLMFPKIRFHLNSVS